MTNKKSDIPDSPPKMRPRARLISLLGDELISDESVAVVELVKNAYDADADSVIIKFEVDETNIPIRLVITDDGHGMDLKTVLNAWFEPGTIMKKKASRSPKKRRLYQGAKGVGRFASARLGHTLLLETKKGNSSKGVSVLLDWGDFDDDSYLDQIDLEYEVSEISGLNIGTRLTIEGLNIKKSWEEDDYKDLHYRLSRLISPFNEISDFKIELDIPNHPELTGKVEAHPLTKRPIYNLSGIISNTGIVNAKLTVAGKNKKTFKNHSLVPKPENGEEEKENEVIGCGGFEFEIRAWDRDRDGLGPYMLKYDMTLGVVRETLNEYCGVSIYRDGFRVHPYGETGDDWLSLDNRSRQNPTMHLAKNQVIASIKTSRKLNPKLIDRTTREGLVHNPEFEELKKWFKEVLTILEGERYRSRPRDDAKPEYTSTLFEAFDMTEVVDEVDKQLGTKHPVTKLVTKKDQEIRAGVKKLQEHYSRVLLAAGLGQLVDLVIHEIGAPLGRITREIDYVSREISAYDLGKDKNEEMEKSIKSITSWLEQIANLRARLDPKTAGKRGLSTSFSVAEEIVGNLNLYENLIGKQNIQVKFVEPKKPVVVNMSRSNLGQIVANLIDNSVYWLTRHHGDGKGGKINIKLESIKNGFRLIYCDNGPGVDDRDMDRIFEQYFSLKPNGMGLGLYIGRQVIEPYGKLVYRDDCQLPGACFEATFLKNVGL